MSSVDAFVGFLKDYNQRTNIYSEKAYDRLPFHLRDSELLGHLVVARGNHVVDIGSGSGLPSVVMAITCPSLRVWAVESAHRKACFLNAAKTALGLNNLEVVHDDIRAFLRKRPNFALFTAKAFAPLPDIISIVKSRVMGKNGGLFVPISARQWDMYRALSGIEGVEIQDQGTVFQYACYPEGATRDLPAAFHVKH
ncbi:MAG: RsmG family class I SAM-dependent methyltransferase [Candidatus Margulisiibacteriota bacterium]